VCVAEVTVPARLLGVVPSPQLTVTEETVPSGSVVEKVRVTNWPVLTGLGERPAMLTAGGLSFMVTELVAWPNEPLLSVTIILMMNV
jgi:hypothetical protein